MKFNLILLMMVIRLARCDFPYKMHQPRPLMFSSWPPSHYKTPLRSSLMVQLRQNSNRSPSSMFLKSGSSPHYTLANSGRFGGQRLKSSPSMHLILKTGPPTSFKRPYSAYASQYSSPPKSTITVQANKPTFHFQNPKNSDYVYEKVVPKFQDSVKLAGDGPIHTIPAPNLSLQDAQPIPEITIQNVNNHLDADFPKFDSQGKPSERPIHQYQVTENAESNDKTIKNHYTGQQSFFAPDPDPSLPSRQIRPSADPLNDPSNSRPLPLDVQQNIQNSALIQNVDYLPNHQPFTGIYSFPIASQPQLQQHIQQQTSMMDSLHLYNPTYMVQQSNNLFGQHQQHLGDIYRPENGFVSSESVPHSSQLVYNAYDFVKPTRPAASAGQIYSAAQDALTELQNLQLASSQLQQLVPSTQPTYHEHSVHEAPDEALPTFAQLIDPKYSYNQIPENTVDYNGYQQQTYEDFQPQQLITQNNQFQELVDQDERQNENDKILQRAQEELFKKQQLAEQHSISAHDLHQQALVEQFKSTPLRIVVPDEESNETVQKRVDELFTEGADYFEDGSETSIQT